MGYTTEFEGKFVLNKPLDPHTETRRMARKVPKKYGVEGEFYVGGKGYFGQEKEKNILDYNRPPATQPSLWLHWKPSDEATEIVWDGGEKFYEYEDWLRYLCDKILSPRGYEINGSVKFQGEESDDFGWLHSEKNDISLTHCPTGRLAKILFAYS